MSDPLKECAERLIAKAKKGGIAHDAFGPWSFGLSFQGPTAPANIFSAKVHQLTVEKDWGDLGAMAALVGAPFESTPKTIETDANATHYYVWRNP